MFYIINSKQKRKWNISSANVYWLDDRCLIIPLWSERNRTARSKSLVFRTVFQIQGNSARLHSKLHMKTILVCCFNWHTFFVYECNLFRAKLFLCVTTSKIYFLICFHELTWMKQCFVCKEALSDAIIVFVSQTLLRFRKCFPRHGLI